MNSSQRVLNFLCCSHRHQLTEDVGRAKCFWAETVLKARSQIADVQWQRAVILYGNATEVAEILFANDRDRARAELRYARTAAEFAYVLRSLGCKADAELLLEWFCQQLNTAQLTQPESALVEPVRRACTSSKAAACLWLESRLMQAETMVAKGMESVPGAATVH